MSSNPYVADAIAAAKRAGIDANVFIRQINQESGFNPRALSPAGAEGIAQFMPGTARGLGINPFNPVQALNAAAQYMANELRAYGGDIAKALAAYNAGGGAVNAAIARGGKNWRNYLPYETQQYLKIILGGKGNPPPVAPPVSTPAASKPLSQPAATPTPHTHPAAIHPTPHTAPHTDLFGQPYTLSVPSQQAPVRPQPLFQQPQAFSVPQQRTTPAPTPKPKTIFGIPFALSVQRQPSTPIQKPKPARPQSAPKLAPKKLPRGIS